MSVQAFDILFSGNLSSLLREEHHSSTSITCLEVCENFLYIGCRNGYIFKCEFKKSSKATEQTVSIQKSLNHYTISSSPIIQMKAMSAINQLLVLSEDTLTILNLETLSLVKNLKLKNVTCFCLNENPLNEDPFTVEICVGSRKKIIYIHLNINDQMKIIKEIATYLTPTSLVMDGSHICFSMGLEYCMVDILSGEMQELFAIDTPDQIPIIFRVSKGEFLLTGPGGLGVFVLSQGFSEKPPINFSSIVSALTFHHPYVIAVCQQGICFYSLIDQQCKQTIAIDNVRLIVNGDGQVFASTSIDIFGLLPISWETQLEKLLSENRAEEALQFALNVHISSNNKEQHSLMLRNLEQKVAFQRISSGRFQDAIEMLERCNIDPREVINYNFESLLVDSINKKEFLVFFLDFLQRWRFKDIPFNQKQAVDGALLQYLVEHDQSGVQLLDFIVDCSTDYGETCSRLESSKRFHCLATFKASKENLEEAFGIWDHLIKKEIEDAHFPGYTFVAEQLAKSQDVSLIWRFSGEILKIDEEAGVKIFTSTTLPSLKPRAVMDHLRHFPRSLQTYLEFLIREKKDGEEAFHTQLALIYIDDISQGDKNRTSPSHRMTVNKLRSLLRTSPKLDLIKLSDTLDSPVFPYEHAIVCGRLGNHAAAINTFINNLKDLEAAEEYCACVDDHKAWNALLIACVSDSQTCKLDWVTDLLRRRPHQFDVPSALNSLPDDTKISLIAPFVNFAVREAVHQKRMKSVEKSLRRVDQLTKQVELTKLEATSFSIEQSSHCSVCKKRLDVQTGFLRFPNGVMAHPKCAPSQHVCPVTGHLFQVGT